MLLEWTILTLSYSNNYILLGHIWCHAMAKNHHLRVNFMLLTFLKTKLMFWKFFDKKFRAYSTIFCLISSNCISSVFILSPFFAAYSYICLPQDQSALYIFLELVSKGSLASLYSKYRLDSQVPAYTRQILSGLKYLHDRNVVHRYHWLCL